jgi:hypothetical protein
VMWPRSCSGSFSSVVNRSFSVQRVLHRSHLFDSFFFWVIERPATLVSRDRVSRGGAIPLEEGDLRFLTLGPFVSTGPVSGRVIGDHTQEREGTRSKDDMVTRNKRGAMPILLKEERTRKRNCPSSSEGGKQDGPVEQTCLLQNPLVGPVSQSVSPSHLNEYSSRVTHDS